LLGYLITICGRTKTIFVELLYYYRTYGKRRVILGGLYSW